MGPKERVLTIRLMNRLEKQPGYARVLGVHRIHNGKVPACTGLSSPHKHQEVAV